MLSLNSLVHQESPKFPAPAGLVRTNQDHLACAHFLSALAAPVNPSLLALAARPLGATMQARPEVKTEIKAEEPKKGDVSWLLNEDKEPSPSAACDPAPWFQPNGPQCKREETFTALARRHASQECSRSPSPGAHPVAPQMSPPLSHVSSKNWQEEAQAHGPMGPRASSVCASSGDEDSENKKQWTISLDAELAAYIYQIRPRNAGSRYGSMAEAARIGAMHGVSPKTIRDIWNRKSWVKATRKLWTTEEAASFIPRRHRRNSNGGSDGRDKKRARVETE